MGIQNARGTVASDDEDVRRRVHIILKEMCFFFSPFFPCELGSLFQLCLFLAIFPMDFLIPIHVRYLCDVTLVQVLSLPACVVTIKGIDQALMSDVCVSPLTT
jgi:hypothetical protein